MKSWITENLANMKRRIMENLANTESRVMDNSVNTDNRVVQDSGARNQKKEKCHSKQKASSMVVPKVYYQDTKTQIVKDPSKRVG
jgi:hypothetical protein